MADRFQISGQRNMSSCALCDYQLVNGACPECGYPAVLDQHRSSVSQAMKQIQIWGYGAVVAYFVIHAPPYPIDPQAYVWRVLSVLPVVMAAVSMWQCLRIRPLLRGSAGLSPYFSLPTIVLVPIGGLLNEIRVLAPDLFATVIPYIELCIFILYFAIVCKMWLVASDFRQSGLFAGLVFFMQIVLVMFLLKKLLQIVHPLTMNTRPRDENYEESVVGGFAVLGSFLLAISASLASTVHIVLPRRATRSGTA